MRSMKAIGVMEAGPPANLKVTDLPDPAIHAGDILVRLTYAGVNYGDVIRRKRGLFPSVDVPPHILGFEGCGRILEIGAGVQGFKIGDRVTFLIEKGAYAQIVAVPARHAFPVPEDIADATAAAVMCTGLTATSLFSMASLQPGTFAVVHGAAGGVGSLLLGLLKAHGVKTVAVVSNDDKATHAYDAGADFVCISSREDFAVATQKATNDIGAQVIFDCIGQAVSDGNGRAIARGGTWFYFGSPSGHAVFPANRVLMNALTIRGFVVFDLLHSPAVLKSRANDLFDLIRRGTIRPTIHAILPMDEAHRAHDLLEQRQVLGKVLLDMR